MIVRFCYAVYLQLLNQHNQEFRPIIPDPLSRGAREGLGTRLTVVTLVLCYLYYTGLQKSGRKGSGYT